MSCLHDVIGFWRGKGKERGQTDGIRCCNCDTRWRRVRVSIGGKNVSYLKRVGS